MEILLLYSVTICLAIVAGVAVYFLYKTVKALKEKAEEKPKEKIKIHYITYEATIWTGTKIPLQTHGLDFEKNITKIWIKIPDRPRDVRGYLRGELILPPGVTTFKVRIRSEKHNEELGYYCQLAEDFEVI